MPIPKEIRDAASDAEDVSEQVFETAAPAVKASKSEVNSIVGAVNKVMPLFGMSERVESATMDYDDEPLSEDLVRFLTMILSAAEDAGIDDLSVAVMDDLYDGRSLEMLAGQIAGLARNQAFKTWLKTEKREPAKAAPKAEGPNDSADGEDAFDDMDLFASRMG